MTDSLGKLDAQFDRALAWRKKELTVLRFAVGGARDSERTIMCRAAIGLLYAHWEGFVREAGTAYVKFVARFNLDYSELAPNFLALACQRTIMNNTASGGFLGRLSLVNFFLTGLEGQAKIPWKNAISTRANLNSLALREVIATLGLSYKEFELDEKPVVDRLVKIRNSVAHGEGVSIDESDYEALHSRVLVLLDVLRDQLSAAALGEAYRRPHSA